MCDKTIIKEEPTILRISSYPWYFFKMNMPPIFSQKCQISSFVLIIIMSLWLWWYNFLSPGHDARIEREWRQPLSLSPHLCAYTAGLNLSMIPKMTLFSPLSLSLHMNVSTMMKPVQFSSFYSISFKSPPELSQVKRAAVQEGCQMWPKILFTRGES